MAYSNGKSQPGMPQDNDPDWDKASGDEDCAEVKKLRKKPEDNDPDWDKALEDEDCVAVKKLLQNNKDLLSKGWSSEDMSLKGEDDILVRNLLEKLLNKGSKENVKVSQKLKGTLKGRTALHVAARRGDLKLLEFIVWDILHVGGKCSAHSCRVLEVIHSDYELDALAMAAASGNREIIKLLMKTSRDCEFNPYHVGRDVDHGSASCEEDGYSKDALSTEDADKMEGILKGIMEDALEKSPWPFVVKDLYARDCDFNFNSLETFNLHLFHFTFSTWEANTDDDVCDDAAIRLVRERIFDLVWKDKLKAMLLRYLFLHLKDGQGRTPLHVAVDSDKVKEFRDLLCARGTAGSNLNVNLIKDILNAKDSAGRTPLYRAAAKNQLVAVSELLKDVRINVNAEITYGANQWGRCVDLDKLSWKNGFKSDCVYVPEEKLRMKAFNKKDNAQGGPGHTINRLDKISSTALHVAIILEHENIVKDILNTLMGMQDSQDVECRRQFIRPTGAWKESTLSFYKLSTMKLAVLVGSVRIMRMLLQAEDWKPGLFTSKQDEQDYPSFHLAAALGNRGIVKAFLDSQKGNFDFRVVDRFSNTALHHALKGKYVKVYPHLVDYVGCHNVFRWRWNNDDWKSEWLAKSRDITDMRSILESNENAKGDLDRYGQRMGSINLLLEVGIDMWEKNKMERTASPEPDAPRDFAKWWYEKVANETQEAKRKVSDSANAIAVTATLVATASYLGPVQPPLGYNGDNSLQANILAVKIFVVCDSLSFYLALCAIISSLLPALPLRELSMFKGQVQRKTFVAVVVAFFLFPSIVFVFLAFATAYIAVIHEHGLAHHGLIVATTVGGGFFCVLVMIMFSSRLHSVFTTLPKEFKSEIVAFFKENFFVEKLVSLVGGKPRREELPPVLL